MVSICFQIITAIVTWVKRISTEHAISKLHAKVEQVQVAQVETKHELNSRLTELLAIVKAAAHAEGRLEGIEEQKRRAMTGDTGLPDIAKSPDS